MKGWGFRLKSMFIILCKEQVFLTDEQIKLVYNNQVYWRILGNQWHWAEKKKAPCLNIQIEICLADLESNIIRYVIKNNLPAMRLFYVLCKWFCLKILVVLQVFQEPLNRIIRLIYSFEAGWGNPDTPSVCMTNPVETKFEPFSHMFSTCF